MVYIAHSFRTEKEFDTGLRKVQSDENGDWGVRFD